MDPANGREAMREIELDIEEGADMIMVKPAMPYLDLIRQARDRFDVPVAAYQVSGEFSMIVAAARNGWLDRERAMLESLTSIRRAGADVILTYFAKDAAQRLLRRRPAPSRLCGRPPPSPTGCRSRVPLRRQSPESRSR